MPPPSWQQSISDSKQQTPRPSSYNSFAESILYIKGSWLCFNRLFSKQNWSTDVQCLLQMVINIIFIFRTNKTGRYAYSLSHLPTSEDKLDSLISAMGLIKTWCQKNWVLEKERNGHVQIIAAFQSAYRLFTDLKLQTDKSTWGKRREKDSEADIYLAAG